MNTTESYINNSGPTDVHGCPDTEIENYIAKIHDHFNVICSSFLIVIGTVGNIATYCVFRQRVYRKNVMANMFRYLSILDTVFLWTIVLQMVIKGLGGVSLFHAVTRVCPFMAFWLQTLLTLANWMLVVITLTRLVHLKFPFKTKTICSQFNYNMFLVITHLYVIGVFVGILVYAQTQITDADYENIRSCYLLVSRSHVQPQVFKMLYSFTNFVGPAIALIITNVLIVLELRQVRVRRERLLGSVARKSMSHGRRAETPTITELTSTENIQHGSSNNASVDLTQTEQDRSLGVKVKKQKSMSSSVTSRSWVPSWISDARSHGVDFGYQEDLEDTKSTKVRIQDKEESLRDRSNSLYKPKSFGKSREKYQSRTQSLTLMLLTASALFLILNTPFWAIHFGLFKLETTSLARYCNGRMMLFDILFLMRYSNNSINFIFYCAIGSRFRRELLTWVKQCCH